MGTEELNVTVTVLADVLGTFYACISSRKEAMVVGPTPPINHELDKVW